MSVSFKTKQLVSTDSSSTGTVNGINASSTTSCIFGPPPTTKVGMSS